MYNIKLQNQQERKGALRSAGKEYLHVTISFQKRIDFNGDYAYLHW